MLLITVPAAPSCCSNNFFDYFRHSTGRFQSNNRTTAIKMASAPSTSCIAAVLQLEDIEEEAALMDHATRAAETAMLLALLGSAAASPPTLQTLDFLTRCFDSSARLKPTLQVLPCFPFTSGDLADRLEALGPPDAVHSSPKLQSEADCLVSTLNQRRQQHSNSPSLRHITQPAIAQPSALTSNTQARVIGGWEGPLQFKTVAVGGTFDRLHAGHRLLLAATALVATQRIYVGVTADKLLANKRNKQLLEPYEVRTAAAVDYMRAVNPRVEVTAGQLVDPKIPPAAATQADFDAIVVSEETIGGAEEINRVRASLGFEPLVVVVVGLLSGSATGPKLSSTDLRAAHAESGSTGTAAAVPPMSE